MKRQRSLRSLKRRKQITGVVSTVLSVFCFLVMVFPIYWMAVTSLKVEKDVFKSPPDLIPLHANLDAYVAQLTSGVFDIPRSMLNSFLIAGSCMVISAVLAILAAYGLARFRIRGKKLIVFLFLISQMLPQTSSLIPNFIIFKKIGIYNTYLAPIVANCTLGIPFCVLMMRTYFLSVPKEIDEAARIDGCNSLQSFVKVMLPMCSGGVAVSFVFSFLFGYSDMLYSLTYVNDSTKWPITTGIYNAVGRYGVAWSQAMAFGCMVVIPVLIIFIVMQKYIIEGLSAGAVKG
ncbi:MAG: carbohydrate ABC transporter permease [Candidatus Limivivens sp.]|nr:carbohydrate ABC transporter permease [Candidatus Limivivens sp.]